MDCFYEYQTKIGSREVDGQGHCRPSALLGELQEAAVLAAEEGGFGREHTIREYGAFWMLARIWYRLERPVSMDDALTVRTWHRGGTGASMYRDFDLYIDGAPAGEAVSVWVLADVKSRRLLRLRDVSILEGTSGGTLCKDMLLPRLRLPGELAGAERRTLHYSDTDINGHVNNTRYADFACDALRADLFPRGSFVQQLQIGYNAECRPGETLSLLTAREGERHFVRGVDDAGGVRFEAALTLGGQDSGDEG